MATNRRGNGRRNPYEGWRDTGLRNPVGAKILESPNGKRRVGVLTQDGDMQARDRERAEREARQRNV